MSFPTDKILTRFEPIQETLFGNCRLFEFDIALKTMAAVVYQISIGSLKYIGVTSCIKFRSSTHKCLLNSGLHHNKKLQARFNNRQENVYIDILETISVDGNRSASEMFWIAYQISCGHNVANRVSKRIEKTNCA